MAVRVTAPDGTEWVVRRRWIPGRDTRSIGSRFRRRFGRVARRTADGFDGASGCGDAIGEGLLAALAVVALVIVIFFVVVPLLVALAEIAILLLAALLILLARVLLRRPWVVEAVRPDGEVWRWDVVGWRASGDACRAIAQRLEAGIVPPPGVVPT